MVDNVCMLVDLRNLGDYSSDFSLMCWLYQPSFLCVVDYLEALAWDYVIIDSLLYLFEKKLEDLDLFSSSFS